MGIATKYRRKINVNGRCFLWYVREDEAAEFGDALTVISMDKHFIVTYPLNQPNETNHLIIKGREFAGLTHTGSWQRVLCPHWENVKTITPSFVRALIEWCFQPLLPLVLIDYQGNRISENDTPEISTNK